MAEGAGHVSGMRVLNAHTGEDFESGALHRPHPDTGGRLPSDEVVDAREDPDAERQPRAPGATGLAQRIAAPGKKRQHQT